MYCNQCGNQIPNGSRFCSFCGADLTVVQSAPQPAPVQSDPYFDIRHGVLVKYKGRDKNVVVPAGVVEIEFEAFTEYSPSSIVIPEGCKKVYIKSHIGTIYFPTTIEDFSVWTGQAFFAPGTKKINGSFRSDDRFLSRGICRNAFPKLHIPSSVESMPEDFFIEYHFGNDLDSFNYRADHLVFENINDFALGMRRAILTYQGKCRYCGGDFKKVFLLGEKCASCGKAKDYDSRWHEGISAKKRRK